eukprot:snap_masked-scaffold_9-processed-gene-9.35-mRNA-1 protein AED:1.00 eAED:1.00 QI:0/0/0/0/1/1/3/0/60
MGLTKKIIETVNTLQAETFLLKSQNPGEYQVIAAGLTKLTEDFWRSWLRSLFNTVNLIIE